MMLLIQSSAVVFILLLIGEALARQSYQLHDTKVGKKTPNLRLLRLYPSGSGGSITLPSAEQRSPGSFSAANMKRTQYYAMPSRPSKPMLMGPPTLTAVNSPFGMFSSMPQGWTNGLVNPPPRRVSFQLRDGPYFFQQPASTNAQPPRLNEIVNNNNNPQPQQQQQQQQQFFPQQQFSVSQGVGGDYYQPPPFFQSLLQQAQEQQQTQPQQQQQQPVATAQQFFQVQQGPSQQQPASETSSSSSSSSVIVEREPSGRFVIPDQVPPLPSGAGPWVQAFQMQNSDLPPGMIMFQPSMPAQAPVVVPSQMFDSQMQQQQQQQQQQQFQPQMMLIFPQDASAQNSIQMMPTVDQQEYEQMQQVISAPDENTGAAPASDQLQLSDHGTASVAKHLLHNNNNKGSATLKCGGVVHVVAKEEQSRFVSCCGTKTYQWASESCVHGKVVPQMMLKQAAEQHIISPAEAPLALY